MNIEQIKKAVSELTEKEFVTLKIDLPLVSSSDTYNKHIENNVKRRFGVYIFFDPEKQTPIYIGLAGKLDKNGQPPKTQTLMERLSIAPRYNNVTKKTDLPSNEWVNKMMGGNSLKYLFLYVFYAKIDVPSAYIEATLLYHYYRKYKNIPIENKEF